LRKYKKEMKEEIEKYKKGKNWKWNFDITNYNKNYIP
jgi:hypothetical protein